LAAREFCYVNNCKADNRSKGMEGKGRRGKRTKEQGNIGRRKDTRKKEGRKERKKERKKERD